MPFFIWYSYLWRVSPHLAGDTKFLLLPSHAGFRLHRYVQKNVICQPLHPEYPFLPVLRQHLAAIVLLKQTSSQTVIDYWLYDNSFSDKIPYFHLNEKTNF